MSDIATLGIAIDATDVTRGAAELDKLTAAGARAQTSAQKLGAEIQRQNAAMSQTTSATKANADALDRNSKSYRDLDAELERFLAANNKVYAAQRNLSAGQDLLDQGVKAGLISQQTATATLDALTKKYGESGEGAKGASVSTSYLTREIRALGDEAASGRWRQFDGTLAGVSSRLLGLGPAALGVVGGIVAVGAAIALVIAKSEEMARAVKDVQTGFAATGNAGLLSAQQIKSYSDALALLPGVSRDAADKTIAELSRVPYMTAPLFDEVTKHAADFAALLGTDVPKATATIAKAMEDPARAADQLDKQFNLLTVDQRLLIQSYVEHGDRASALAVLLQALEDRSKGLADRGLTPMQKGANDVARAWDDLIRSFSHSDAINSAGDMIGTLLEKTAGFISYTTAHKSDIAAFINQFVQIHRLAVDPIGAVKNIMGGAQQASTTSAADPAAFAAMEAQGATTSATVGVGAGQSEADRSTLDATKQYVDRSDKAKTLIDYENKLKDIYARQTDELKNATGEQAKQIALARQETQEHIDGVQKRIDQLQKVPRGATTPLGINVDRSEMEAGLKAIQVQQDAVKAALAEGQKYRDFYHKAGITSDADYNKATDAANADYLAQEQRFYQQQIALVEADEAKLKALKPASKAQSDQIATAVNEDEKKRIDLLAKEDALTKQIAADSAFRATTAPLIKAQEDFNRALKETQEIQSGVSEAEQRANLEVQLGLKSQTEGAQAVVAARQAAIAQLQQQLAVMVAIHDQSQLDHASDQYIAQAKAIDQVNIRLLQMQAALDPLAQKLNQTFNNDLTSFFDKFGEGGIKTFKDLKNAALDFGKSLWTSIAHEANQKLSDSILKSLGGMANNATGTTGGLGGVVSSWLGLGPSNKGGTNPSTGLPNPTTAASSVADDPMGDFIKNIGSANTGLSNLSDNGIAGMVKSSAASIEKMITGTTTQVSATSATASATSALAALTDAAYAAAGALSGSSTVSGGGSSGGGGMLGGLAGLFGKGSAGGSTATASQMAQADNMDAMATSLSADGVAPFLHGGGIAGRDYAFKRLVDPSVFDGAPRMHGGGIAGLAGYETPAILKKGEEVLTEDDPRHRNNGGRSRSRGGMTVVQNFTVQPTESRASQAQMAARAHAGLNTAARAL